LSSASDRTSSRIVTAAFAVLIGLLAAMAWTALLSSRQEARAAEAVYPPAAGRTEIIFRGNESKGEAELRRAAAEELADFEQEGQRTFDADDAAFQMEQAYRRDGFAFARIDYDVARAADRTTLVFVIDEGPRVRVRDIVLSGNDAVASAELIPFFHGGKTDLFAEEEIPFVKSDAEAAPSSIRSLYLSRGYLDAAIDEPRYVFTEDRHQVDIHVSIREGARYEVQSLEYHGDIPADARGRLDDLRREVLGMAYTGRTSLIVRARTMEIYADLGYADAVVDVSERKEAATGRVWIDVAVAEGPLVTVDRIRVQGNLRTREDFIRQRLQLKAGDRYSLALEKESFRELYKSGVFSKVAIDLEKTDDPSRRVLLVTVEEAPSWEVSIEPGYGSYELLRLKTGLRQKNLFGTGRSWNSEVLGSLKAQRVTTGLTDPWFLNFDLRGDLTGFVSRREEPSFTRNDVGATFSLTKELAPNLTGTAATTFRRTDLSETGVAIEAEDVQDDYDFSSVKGQLTYDTRNDLFFPTSGQRSFGAVEHADTLLGGDVTFTRLTGGTRFFFRLASSTVAGFRYSTGLILPGEDEFTVPLAERFFNGGENTVRSFKESELGPRDSTNDPTGGLAYNVISVELRQRLIGNFTGTLFADFGNVAPNRTREEEGKPPYSSRSRILSDTLDDFFRGFRTGIGCGLQYLLPVGPARLDIAFNPDRDTDQDEDRYVVHFSVGMAF
jgi:outer membrane protein assembly complex protein YaeT